MAGIGLAHRPHISAALATCGGNRLEPDVEQILVELHGGLRGSGVIGLVGDDIVAGCGEARDTGRVGPVQARHGQPTVRPDGRERFDTRFIACERPRVASVADAEPQIHALVRAQAEARRLDPEFMRHRRRGPGRQCRDGKARDEVAHEPHQSPESLLLLTPECGVARYGNTWL
jgi:hypothetical protein